MVAETEQFFLHVVFEGSGRYRELLEADYTFVNERLARHYGIPGVSGDEFRMVSYPNDQRRGLLGHGSVLTLTPRPRPGPTMTSSCGASTSWPWSRSRATVIGSKLG